MIPPIQEGSPVMRIPVCPAAGKFGTVRLIYGRMASVHFHEDARGGATDRTLSGIPLSALELVPQEDLPLRME